MTTTTQQPTVLLVEDTVMNAEVIQDMFGYDEIPGCLVHVTDGESALITALRIHPALILMDIRLPDLDGLTVAEKLKRDPRTADIPIWAYTAHSMEGDLARAKAAGCDNYIIKPLDFTSTAKRLKEFLEERKVVADAQDPHCG